MFQGCSSGRQAVQVRVFDLLQALSLPWEKKNPKQHVKQNQTNKALVTSLDRTVLGIWAWTVMPVSLSIFLNDGFVWHAFFSGLE